jgi:hypothetical protein
MNHNFSLKLKKYNVSKIGLKHDASNVFLIANFHHLGREKKVVQMALRKSAIGFEKFSII